MSEAHLAAELHLLHPQHFKHRRLLHFAHVNLNLVVKLQILGGAIVQTHRLHLNHQFCKVLKISILKMVHEISKWKPLWVTAGDSWWICISARMLTVTSCTGPASPVLARVGSFVLALAFLALELAAPFLECNKRVKSVQGYFTLYDGQSWRAQQ